LTPQNAGELICFSKARKILSQIFSALIFCFFFIKKKEGAIIFQLYQPQAGLFLLLLFLH
jgi:hypothetical protein